MTEKRGLLEVAMNGETSEAEAQVVVVVGLTRLKGGIYAFWTRLEPKGPVIGAEHQNVETAAKMMRKELETRIGKKVFMMLYNPARKA